LSPQLERSFVFFGIILIKKSFLKACSNYSTVD